MQRQVLIYLGLGRQHRPPANSGPSHFFSSDGFSNIGFFRSFNFFNYFGSSMRQLLVIDLLVRLQIMSHRCRTIQWFGILAITRAYGKLTQLGFLKFIVLLVSQKGANFNQHLSTYELTLR